MTPTTRETRAILGALISAVLLVSQAQSLAKDPTDDADYLWHMADTSNETGARGSLEAHGAVRFDVSLKERDHDESLARGGDGKVARFDGGYLALANDGDLKVNPERWTVLIRMRDPQGTWRSPILGSYGSDRQVSFALRALDGSKKPSLDRNLSGGEVPTIYAWMFQSGGPRSVPGSSSLLELVWGAREPNDPRVDRIEQMQPELTRPNPLQQDVLNAVMKPCYPIGLIGPTDWHDIVMCLTGPKLQLWIDGVLVDEEFPIGVTRQRTLPFLIGAGHQDGELRTGFRGLIDHVAIWNRPLSPTEIAVVCGGADCVRQRESAILGDESPSMQYFRARGHNRKAGDLIPYWDAQTNTFRLFYLILRRNMHSKWDGGHGGLEIWQASTKDLATWQQHPVTIPVTEQWEAWNGTGAVAFHDGRYNWFYPTPDYDGERGGIQRAISTDGVHFTKSEPHPFLEGGDCEIFQTEDGTFHMVKAGPTVNADTRPVADKTLVAWVKLDDLNQAGGSVLTIEHPDGARFDALVFGERTPRRWMPGSDGFRRTPASQAQWPEETAGPDEVVQVALVFQGGRGTLYRDGVVYASYDIAEPVTFPSGSSLIIGKRHTTAGSPERSYFRGRVLDARLYDRALTAPQIAALEPDVAGAPQPVAWYDFEDGSTRDRTGNFSEGRLYGGARIEDGALVVKENDYLKTPGVLFTQVSLTSQDLETWTEQEQPFISSDKRLAICPNVFRFGEWCYYICGSGVWRSHEILGPWKEHQPLRLDNLAVPKTGAFGNKRRIYAGFLPDGGWGGNSVLRDLVQDKDGRLGTRFVPELIPQCGDRLPVETTVRLETTGESRAVELRGIPNDFRLQMEVTPEAGVTRFGIDLRARGDDPGCKLLFEPQQERVRFGKMTDSGGRVGAGPAIESVAGLDRSFKVDVVARHDILDAEIAEFRSVTTRFWSPGNDCIHLFVEGGAVTFRNICVRPLKKVYEPYPNWSETPTAATTSPR